MKSNAQPSFYFSSCLLKTFKQPSSAGEQSLFLKSLLTGNTGSVSRARVNPYTGIKKNNTAFRHSPVSEDTSLNENGWYHNYE